MKKKIWVSHIIKEGSRQHVISYDTFGSKCSEPNCEINEYRAERMKKKYKPWKKVKIRRQYRFTFSVQLSGVGEFPNEAWRDAVEAFSRDPGLYDKILNQEEAI
jgi:hypothetical protein